MFDIKSLFGVAFYFALEVGGDVDGEKRTTGQGG
jgi:hypothetical protein